MWLTPQNITPEDDDVATPYSVTVNVEVRFVRPKTRDAIPIQVTNDPNVPAVRLTEEQIRERYPWDYKQLTEKCKERYADFKNEPRSPLTASDSRSIPHRAAERRTSSRSLPHQRAHSGNLRCHSRSHSHRQALQHLSRPTACRPSRRPPAAADGWEEFIKELIVALCVSLASGSRSARQGNVPPTSMYAHPTV